MEDAPEDAPAPAEAPLPSLSEDAPLERLAAQVLEAWRAKDLVALAALASAGDANTIAELKPESSRYQSIFGEESARMKAVRAWDGRIRECRFQGARARCAFAEPVGGEAMVLTFEREGDRWVFEDLHSPSVADWERWGKRPAPPEPEGVKPRYVDCAKVEPGMPCTPDTPPQRLPAP